MQLSADWYAIVLTLVCVALDVITGYLNAWIHNEVSSSKMREGLTHKFTFAVVLFLSCFMEVTAQHMSIGVDIPTSAAVCIYIVVCELSSIGENLVSINPELASWPFIKQLVAAHKDNSQEGA